MKKIKNKGFSVIEVLISFIVVSILLVSFIPVMTKKKTKSINVSSTTTSGLTTQCKAGCSICKNDEEQTCLSCMPGFVLVNESNRGDYPGKDIKQCAQCTGDNKRVVDNECVEVSCSTAETIHECPDNMVWDDSAKTCKCKEGEDCEKELEAAKILYSCLLASGITTEQYTNGNTSWPELVFSPGMPLNAACGFCCVTAKNLGYEFKGGVISARGRYTQQAYCTCNGAKVAENHIYAISEKTGNLEIYEKPNNIYGIPDTAFDYRLNLLINETARGILAAPFLKTMLTLNNKKVQEIIKNADNKRDKDIARVRNGEIDTVAKEYNVNDYLLPSDSEKRKEEFVIGQIVNAYRSNMSESLKETRTLINKEYSELIKNAKVFRLDN